MRYSRNTILTEDEQRALAGKTAAVIGCGGLGGYLAEMLARLGTGHIKVCDGDIFDETNLNRQLCSTEKNLGSNKAEAVKCRIREISSEVDATAYPKYLNRENAVDILAECDIVLDGLDSIGEKLMLEELCSEYNIPFVHGAAMQWFGQVTTVFPGDETLKKLYHENAAEEHGCPSFTPAVVAGMMVSEALKVLTGKGELMRNRVLFIDLLNGEVHEAKI